MEITLTTALKREYKKRFERNSNYSLRSFARDLGLSSGRLSEILNKESAISQKTLDQVHQKIELTDREYQLIVKIEENKRKGRATLNEVLIDEQFELSPFHMATLTLLDHKPMSLIELKKYAPFDLKTLEGLLLDLVEGEFVRVIIDEMSSYSLCEAKHGKLLFKDKDKRTTYIESCFDLSKNAIREIPKQERIHSASIVKVSKNDIAKIKGDFEKFRLSVIQQIDESELQGNEKPHLLCLSLNPFPKKESSEKEA